MRVFILAAGLLLLTIPTAHAGDDPYFFFAGKPIDPGCFERLLGPDRDDKPVQLDDCENPSRKISNDYRTKPDDRGFYGFEYNRDEGFPFMSYKPVGELKDGTFIVLFTESTGGTGMFDILAAFRRVGDKGLEVTDVIRGGDRCNGGIPDAGMKNGVLTHEIFLTPPDILAVADMHQGIEPYKDLEASAASCYAIAKYEGDTLTGVRLLNDTAPFEDMIDPEWLAQYTYQACFNQYYWDYIRQGEPVDMTLDQVKIFAKGFRKTCMKG